MQTSDLTFNFKAVKQRDEKGEPIKNEKGEYVTTKDDPIVVKVPKLEVTDIQGIIEKNDEKQVKLLLEAVNGIIENQAKQMIDEDRAAARENGLNFDNLTWEYIANIPPATRRGAAISEETWENFIKDYTSVMKHHGKTEEQAEMGAKILSKRFYQVKTNKPVVQALQNNLKLWFANTSQAEDLQEVYENLMSKAEQLLAADAEAILAAI